MLFPIVTLSKKPGNLFPNQISKSMAEIKLLYGVVKWTAALFEFYFPFWFWRMCSHRPSACHFKSLQNSLQIGRSMADLWRHIQFPKWRP